MSVSERERFMPKGILRIDLGAPVPPLVMEVVSEGSANRDLNYKMHLYAAAGVSEYLVCDLGGKRRSRSPRELLMYRLGQVLPAGTRHGRVLERRLRPICALPARRAGKR